MFFGNKENV